MKHAAYVGKSIPGRLAGENTRAADVSGWSTAETSIVCVGWPSHRGLDAAFMAQAPGGLLAGASFQPSAVSVLRVAPGRSPVALPASTSDAAASDPMLGQQWHLADTAAGADVAPVWRDYAGRGVRVGVIDDGFQHTHADLAGRYRTDLDHDFVAKDSDAAPELSSNNHGTAVAGVIAAQADNGHGGAGVAWGADLVGYRVGFGTATSTSEILEAIERVRTLDVANSSWGYGGFFGDNFASATFARHGQAMADAARHGRGGLGTVQIFAAGNERAQGQNVNYHDFQNSSYAIAVGATDRNGNIASFSTPGAAVLVSAPGVGIVTTDRTGSAGYVSGDFAAVGGTSFAAPVVSGVVALMLEADPKLGYRDVQEILAYSASKPAGFAAGARANAAADWNGGGLTYSHDYGFGLVDAHAAVRLAETWQARSTFDNAARLSVSATPKLAIGDLKTGASSIRVGASGLEIDRVEVSVDLAHGRIGDLKLTLISPSGTESVLVDRPGVSSSSTYGSTQTGIRFTMDSVHFWGESATGTWVLKVQDAASGHTGVLNSWGMEFIGDAGAGDTYVYTDAYAALGAQANRVVLRDADGGVDTLNLAAIRSGVSVDLRPGGASAVLGRTLTIDPGTLIENVYAGDGADRIAGNAAGNRISGGRGADLLSGGGGGDVFVYSSLDDGRDVISDFGADDRFDFDALLAHIGYAGTDAFADGWASFARSDTGTSLSVTPGGYAGVQPARELAFLDHYFGPLGRTGAVA